MGTAGVGEPRDDTVETSTTGLRVHYRAWGAAAREGAPTTACLLLHGLGSSSMIWDLVAPLLAERGMAVVAPDQRGHGRTARPESG